MHALVRDGRSLAVIEHAAGLLGAAVADERNGAGLTAAQLSDVLKVPAVLKQPAEKLEAKLIALVRRQYATRARSHRVAASSCLLCAPRECALKCSCPPGLV